MSMQEKIELAIQNDLPNQVAEALQAKLKQADKDAVDLKECKRYTGELQENNKALEATVTSLQEKLNTQETTDKKLKEIREAKAEMEVTIAGLKQTAAEDKCNMMDKLVSKVFGHPSVRIENSGSKGVVIPDNHYTSSTCHDETVTRTEGKD
jgi:tRNA/tmRNA/rRNA uracil-C5-methylase (TrmA/RlmC/RlmD family)